MAVVLTAEEKSRARHHAGYLQTQSAYTFGLGIPLNVQPQFMIEGALNNLLDEVAYAKFRQLLCRCDQIEEQIYCGSDLADIQSIDTIKVNPERVKDLAKYYVLAMTSMCNLLGIVPNPWDQRDFIAWGGGGGINVSVIG